jgi:hypothetical protein
MRATIRVLFDSKSVVLYQSLASSCGACTWIPVAATHQKELGLGVRAFFYLRRQLVFWYFFTVSHSVLSKLECAHCLRELAP